MVEYRDDSVVYRDNPNVVYVKRRGGLGRTLGILFLVALVIVAILFATGFLKGDVKPGAMPTVDVSAKGGKLPDVDVESKKVVVGTK